MSRATLVISASVAALWATACAHLNYDKEVGSPYPHSEVTRLRLRVAQEVCRVYPEVSCTAMTNTIHMTPIRYREMSVGGRVAASWASVEVSTIDQHGKPQSLGNGATVHELLHVVRYRHMGDGWSHDKREGQIIQRLRAEFGGDR